MGINIKGGEAGNIKKLKSDLKKSSGGGTWVKSIPKDEELKVRFLTEPSEWFKYEEHYIEDVNYFPCTGDDCPGCAAMKKDKKARSSRRYLANALDVENERVVPLKLPATLANRLVSRFERYGTLMDRDYVLIREGSGTNTVYDADTEPKSKRAVSKYDLLDLEKVLVEQFEDAFGEDGDDDSDDGDDEPKRSKKSKSKRLAVEDDDTDDSDDDEEEEPKPRKKRSSSKSKKTASSSRRRRR